MVRFGYITVFALALSSCSTILPSDEGTVPEWFEARRAQVIEDGYPSLRAAAVSQNVEVSGTPWLKIANELTIAQRDLERNAPGAITVTAEDMRAWVEEQKALVAKGEEPY